VTIDPAELTFAAGETDKTITLTATEPNLLGYITAEFVSLHPAYTITNP
jgi:hypothetical protein